MKRARSRGTRFRGRRPEPGSLAALALLAVLSATALAGTAWRPVPALAGRVVDDTGRAAAAVWVTATRTGSPAAWSTLTRRDGTWDLGPLPPGEYGLTAHGIGWSTAAYTWRVGDTSTPELRVSARDPAATDMPGSFFLAMLPDGPEKRRFVLDCTGCHVFDDFIALPEGTGRSAAGWVDAVVRMLGNAGPASNFPVISIGREPKATAAFLTAAIRPGETPKGDSDAVPAGRGSEAVVTEFAIPEPGDLPHDLAITADGRVVITGMFTHRMYVLSPDDARFDFVPIPVQTANPRAVEIDAAGRWWVLLGAPMRVARYDPSATNWESWPIGMYPHSIGLADGDRVWFNGHFTRRPELIGFLESDGKVVTDTVPAHERAAEGFGPIPYELRIGPDGRVWVSELAGNRVFAYDPGRDRYEVWNMHTPVAGPRRLDVGPDGIVWIPEYAASALARLDPATGTIEEFPLPIANAAPYVARVDPRSGAIWIGTGAADAILRFDPATRRFDTFPLPTRGAMIRHMAIDPRNGDVWAAYGASPGIPSKVARLRVRG